MCFCFRKSGPCRSNSPRNGANQRAGTSIGIRPAAWVIPAWQCGPGSLLKFWEPAWIRIDPEGRLLRVKVADLEIASVYLPSGSSGEHRQEQKELWMDDFLPWAEPFLSKSTPVILGGDLNIAHTERDIFYAKGNENTSGFLPHEREWFTNLLETGWRDVVREHYGECQGPYSWWSNRGRARELDRGWRIDYLLTNASARERFQSAVIHREGGLTISDHAPVSIDLEP